MGVIFNEFEVIAEPPPPEGTPGRESKPVEQVLPVPEVERILQYLAERQFRLWEH